MDKPRIIHINTSSKGGAARIALDLNSRLNEETKFTSVLAYGRGRDLAGSIGYKFSSKSEVFSHGLITRLTGVEGKGTWYSTQSLISYLDRNRFDLVHLHNLHGYYLNFSLFTGYLKQKKIPVVWTLHDCWSFTGSCASPGDCSQYLSGCGHCRNKRAYPKNYIDNSAYMWREKKRAFADSWKPVIVTPSKWLADKVKTTFLKDHRIEIIPNGVDTGIFKPYEKERVRTELDLAADDRIVLFIATDLNNRLKGMEYFLEAGHKIRDIDNLVLVTAGQKSKRGYKQKVKIIEFGYIPDKDLLAKIYSAADVYCSTSLDEIFGLTVTEAMACGTPVVGFNVGGIPEQVTDDCGLVVASNDTEKLAEALKSIICSNDKQNLYAKNCRKRVIENYTTEIMLKRYIDLYENLLSSGGSGKRFGLFL